MNVKATTNNRMVQKGAILALAISAQVILPACGGGENGNPFVNDVNIFTFQEESDAWVELTADVNTGKASLPAIDFPVSNPSTGMEYGSISVIPKLGENASVISLAVNLSAVLEEPVANSNLPNGLPIPVAGLDPENVLAYNINNGPSKAYAAFTGQDGILGAAIAVKEFDALGKELGQSNFFPSFHHEDNDLYGIAGIFTSPNSGLSGFGVFADLGTIADAIRNNLGQSEMQVESLALFKLGSGSSLEPTTISRRKQRKLFRGLYKLHRKRKRLHIR